MRRREFIAALGGAATWPLAARAQQPALPVIGYLRSTSLAVSTPMVTAFRQGLKEVGFVEGQNVAIEYRFADNQVDRLPALVTDLIRRPVAVIALNASAVPVAKAATTTVPLVFVTGSDPVVDGFVTSLNRPGGNVTGVSFVSGVLGSKRFELLRHMVPKATKIGMLMSAITPEAVRERKDLEAVAQAIGLQLIVREVISAGDVESAFASFVQRGAGAVFIGVGPFFFTHRDSVVALSARHRLPAMYPLRDLAVAGGLMSYGASISDAYRLAGNYTGRILKGEKAGDLPVMQPTKFDLVINLKTAKALGLDIPPTLLVLADEVIE